MVHSPQDLTLLGAMQQPGDCRNKSRLVITSNNKLAVLFAHDGLHVSYIDRRDGAACRHSLEQCIRHLLCIGRQGKDVKRAENRFRRNPELCGEASQRAALDSVAGNDEAQRSWASEHCEHAEEPSDILFRTQRSHSADHQFAGPPSEAGDGVAHRRTKPHRVDAVWDICHTCGGDRQTRDAKSSSWRDGTTTRAQRASANRLNNTRRGICESASRWLKPASKWIWRRTGDNRAAIAHSIAPQL
jgi:hypothetical protein